MGKQRKPPGITSQASPWTQPSLLIGLHRASPSSLACTHLLSIVFGGGKRPQSGVEAGRTAEFADAKRREPRGVDGVADAQGRRRLEHARAAAAAVFVDAAVAGAETKAASTRAALRTERSRRPLVARAAQRLRGGWKTTKAPRADAVIANRVFETTEVRDRVAEHTRGVVRYARAGGDEGSGRRRAGRAARVGLGKRRRATGRARGRADEDRRLPRSLLGEALATPRRQRDAEGRAEEGEGQPSGGRERTRGRRREGAGAHELRTMSCHGLPNAGRSRRENGYNGRLLAMRRPLASFASFASLVAATFVLGLAFDARGDAGGSAGGGSGGSAGSSSAGSGGSTDNGDKDKDTDKRPATCDDACDKIAAKCVDACEEAHKGKPLPRVTCKIACGDARRACSDKCPKK